ncbi:MAG: hypothetical protein BSOLF_0426 [Candidatus Carbobacillus altaicus]|uniref:Uncharacterized protein n=1 Tax=Candidatus Carbonibacillus altaicus TaxID=2163959 RepID=A0A2R6Y5I5_9BACL|nr:MAG: hypothetical protein BSOLF_0426 [Candidatus Carbobacillus altaicus]
MFGQMRALREDEATLRRLRDIASIKGLATMKAMVESG